MPPQAAMPEGNFKGGSIWRKTGYCHLFPPKKGAHHTKIVPGRNPQFRSFLKHFPQTPSGEGKLWLAKRVGRL
jgi:hypothetical protein